MTSLELHKITDKKKTNKKKNNLKLYIKDNVFDNFDIGDLIKKDFLIPKAEFAKFLYKKDIHNLNISSSSTDDISQSNKDQDEIISEINNTNHFNIEIEKLILTYKNGYEVPFIDVYTPIKLIGQGHFGLVLSVIHNETKMKMAAKIIHKKSFTDEYYLSETYLLNKLNHERIIKLYEVIDTKNYLFIFTELCSGGSLKDYIISKYNSNNDYFMKDSEVSTIIKNILQGVEYLVNNGIIHRDLKPENIMFRKENDINSLVLCDFGLAKENMNNSLLESKCGTLIFMAPEIIMNRAYDSLVDIWSVGIIMYILESGGSHPLYNPITGSKFFVKLINNKANISFPDFFPVVARNFFLKMCKYEPFFRYNAIKALHHPWIKRINKGIPLNILEDIEKRNKIKNFKNTLLSFVCLKQLTTFFKKSDRTIQKGIKSKNSFTSKYKLMSIISNLNKNINDISFKDNMPHLPPIIKPFSPKNKDRMNGLHLVRSSKKLISFRQSNKSLKLFPKEEIYNNFSPCSPSKERYNMCLTKQKKDKNKHKNISLLNKYIYLNSNKDYKNEQNLANKFKDCINKNKYRLFSSNRIKLQKRNLSKNISFSPSKADSIIENKNKLKYSFLN